MGALHPATYSPPISYQTPNSNHQTKSPKSFYASHPSRVPRGRTHAAPHATQRVDPPRPKASCKTVKLPSTFPPLSIVSFFCKFPGTPREYAAEVLALEKYHPAHTQRGKSALHDGTVGISKQTTYCMKFWREARGERERQAQGVQKINNTWGGV